MRKSSSKLIVGENLAVSLLLGILIFTSIISPIIVWKFFPTFNSIGSFGNFYFKIFITFVLITFIIFGVDKWLSANSNIRYPNGLLYILAALSGGVGSFWARNRFRHKTVNHGYTEKNYATTFHIIEGISFGINLCIFLLIIF